MEIKSATVNVILDSAEVAAVIRPLIEAAMPQLGKVTGMKLEDVAVAVTMEAAA